MILLRIWMDLVTQCWEKVENRIQNPAYLQNYIHISCLLCKGHLFQTMLAMIMQKVMLDTNHSNIFWSFWKKRWKNSIILARASDSFFYKAGRSWHGIFVQEEN